MRLSVQKGNQAEVELTQMERQQVSNNVQEHRYHTSITDSNTLSETGVPPTPAAEVDSLPTTTPTVDDLAIMVRPPVQEESDINLQLNGATLMEVKFKEKEEICTSKKAL